MADLWVLEGFGIYMDLHKAIHVTGTFTECVQFLEKTRYHIKQGSQDKLNQTYYQVIYEGQLPGSELVGVIRKSESLLPE